MGLRIEDESGNLNIDFLVGVVIFIGAFLYIIGTIPGFFLPYQTNSVDLGSVVYRTSCLLAEDPGWYVDDVSGVNGTAWEYEDIAKLARVGLAVDKKTPNVLAMDKVSRMSSIPYVLSRDDLGLNNTLVYNYSLKITRFLPDDTDQVLLNISQPSYASNVESIDRTIIIREGEGLYYDNHTFIKGGIAYVDTNATNLSVERHPCFDQTNITVRLTNFVRSNGSYSGFAVYYYVGPYYNDPAKVEAAEGSEYYLFKNGAYMDVADLEFVPFDKGDKLDVVLNMRVIQAKYAALGLNVSRVMLSTVPTAITHQIIAAFPDISLASEVAEDYNLTNPNYRYFDDHGMMTVQVWQV